MTRREDRPTPRAASVRQVADRAGVSLGTVSNVLNRPHLVSESARTRVLHAIAELGFVRNESARALRSGRSSTIAYVVLDASNPFFTDIATGVEEAVGEDITLFLCNTAQDAAREMRYLDMLEQQRVLGILITPLDPSSDRLRGLPHRGTPVVLVDRASADQSQCSVAVDDVLGGELATSHLLEMGHHRLAFVGGPMSIRQVSDRLLGARKAIVSAGGQEDDLLVLETTGLNINQGKEAGARLAGVPAARRPTAVFCANDLLALGLLQQALHLNIEVPGDLAIVGYDDIEFAGAAAIPLTSIRQPRDLLGRTAAKLLLQEASGNPDHVHEQIEFAPELVVRASTRRPRSAR
jgi:LacI family transcriptional regulator